MTDQEKIDKLRNALGVLLTDIEWQDGRFLSPMQPVSALVNPITLKVCDEALEATKPDDTGILKEGSVQSAHKDQHP